MAEIRSFLVGHPYLFVAMCVLIVAIIVVEFRDRLLGAKRIEVHELTSLVNKEDALLLDLRGADAFSKGHIVGAKNLKAGELTADHQFIKQKSGKPIVVIDDNGMQAPAIANKLKHANVAEVYVLKGGISAWQNENLPLVK